MLTDEEAAEAEARYAALPGTQPDAFSSADVSKTPDAQAWFREQADLWRKDGMTYFRWTVDGEVLWLEAWRVRPEKEAPFVGWYTSHPQRSTEP
jgi:hypothetical protein